MKLSALVLGLACLSTGAMAHENGTIKIYDAKLRPQLLSSLKSGKLVLENGKKKSLFTPKSAPVLNKNLEIVRDYFAEKFERVSWDNKGGDIIATVNIGRMTVLDIVGIRNNAAWTGEAFIFGAGSKDLDHFEKAIDVVAHEYTHAVVQTSSKLGPHGQTGALNEHLADVFGSLINVSANPDISNPYLIGATILGGKYAQKAHALRDMMDPSKGLSPQPAHMKELESGSFSKYGNSCIASEENDRCGVHVLNGIPNKMSALIMSAITAEESGKLFYNVMTKRLTTTSKFADYKVALLEECKSLSDDVCAIVDDAAKSVGL